MSDILIYYTESTEQDPEAPTVHGPMDGEAELEPEAVTQAAIMKDHRENNLPPQLVLDSIEDRGAPIEVAAAQAPTVETQIVTDRTQLGAAVLRVSDEPAKRAEDEPHNVTDPAEEATPPLAASGGEGGDGRFPRDGAPLGGEGDDEDPEGSEEPEELSEEEFWTRESEELRQKSASEILATVESRAFQPAPPVIEKRNDGDVEVTIVLCEQPPKDNANLPKEVGGCDLVLVEQYGGLNNQRELQEQFSRTEGTGVRFIGTDETHPQSYHHEATESAKQTLHYAVNLLYPVPEAVSAMQSYIATRDIAVEAQDTLQAQQIKGVIRSQEEPASIGVIMRPHHHQAVAEVGEEASAERTAEIADKAAQAMTPDDLAVEAFRAGNTEQMRITAEQAIISKYIYRFLPGEGLTHQGDVRRANRVAMALTDDQRERILARLSSALADQGEYFHKKASKVRQALYEVINQPQTSEE
ncbi:MAG TPA: hypothetical protein VLF60_04375 [Candidatus Saccharimonadales bacterium]|nr:hypothetical protein [Candidatus Saccharimonadales bacterium]